MSMIPPTFISFPKWSSKHKNGSFCPLHDPVTIWIIRAWVRSDYRTTNKTHVHGQIKAE